MTIPPTPVRARPAEAIPPAAAYTPPPPPLPDPRLLLQMEKRDALLDLLLVLAVGIVGPFLPSLFALLGILQAQPLGAGTDLGTFLIISKWSEALVALSLLLYFALRHRLSARTFALTNPRFPLDFAFVPVILIAVYVVMLVVGLSLAAAQPENLEGELAKRLEFAEQLPTSSLSAALLLVPVALHEEVLFRALMLPYLRRLLGSWTGALIVGSLIFGSLHYPQGTTAMVQIAAVGAVLGIAYILTRSLLAVVVTHFVFDFLQIQLIEWMREMHESGALDGIDAFGG